MIYVGMYGALGGGASLAGHVLSATFSTVSGLPPVWRDLSRNPVLNDLNSLNAYGFDVSSISVDAHDSTGNTVYVTVAGIPNLAEQVQGSVPLDGRRGALGECDSKPADCAGEQPGGGSAGCQHGLSSNRCGRLFHAANHGVWRQFFDPAGPPTGPDCPVRRWWRSAQPLRRVLRRC